ncbi:MAG: Protein kinase [Myxococcaceae bacterium]|nr:Protein kinase [Myxococcaceae bacterium]
MHISGASGHEPAVHELKSFGKYHLLASLGQGGMAKVYLALLEGPSGFQKLLVIKIMRQDAVAGPSEEGARMFWAEARLAARLLHPNIVHTYEVGEHEGSCFMAMEYLDGQPLSAILNRARADREIPLAELLRVVSEIARGLHYAHQLRDFQNENLHVVHRDVSPQNVIVTYDGHGKLVDFGIAKTREGEETQLGLIKGKLDYIAPEQLRGEQVDARADVFSLGAILWEVIAGQRFAGGRKATDLQKVQARLSAAERKLRSIKPDLPEALEAIVERAIALSPDERFADAASFADALDAYLESQNVRPNARVLSAKLSALFASERAELHKVIERQVQRVKEQGRRGEPASGSESTSTDARKLKSGLGLYVADAHAWEGSSIRSMATSARASTVAPERSKRALWVWSGGGLLALATLLSWWSVRGPESTALPGQARQAAARSAAAAAPDAAPGMPNSRAPESASAAEPELAATGTVTIRLKVTPANARVLLDGVLVALPFEGSFRKDAALHHVDVSAPGYRAKKEFVPFEHDQTLELALEPAHAGRRGARLDQLVERAAETVEHHPEPSARPVPAEPKPEHAPHVDPVIERPNPYSTD